MNPGKIVRFNVSMLILMLSCSLIWAAEPAKALAVSESRAAQPAGETSWVDNIARPIQLKGEEITLKFGLESRYRFEYRDDFTLNDLRYEDDAVNLLRNRLNMDLKIKPADQTRSYRFFVEGQAAQSFAQSEVNKSSLFVNLIDLRQLFFEVSHPFMEIPLTLKIGRQELLYGDERFVGPLNWTNTARVFDAVKAVYFPAEWLQMDAFFANVVRNERTVADKTVHSDDFYGLYLSYRKIKDHVADTFLFIRHIDDPSLVSERPGKRGELTEYTMGNRFKGKKGRFDYGAEYALQFGRRARDKIVAWAFHQELGYTFLETRGTPRIYAEYNHASGDRNPSNGTVGTFDNLFPTNHNKYGLMDFMSLKNMNDVMIGASVKPHKKLMLSSDFHWLFLDAKESPWFNASGGVFRAANVNASTQLGEELDLAATYTINKNLSILVGYSHFFSGPFVKDTGRHDDANFLYTQVVLKV